MQLGPLEIAVLEVIWSAGESSVHDVSQKLNRPLAYTTVMTTLDRLYKKGLLGRRKAERAFFYTPLVSRDAWERQRVAGFLTGTRASGELLISCLVDAIGHDASLLDDLERRIRAKRQELERTGGQ